MGERGHVGVDGVGAGFGELRGGVGAGRHAVAGETAVVRGLDVVGGVADHAGGGGVGAEGFQGVGGELGVGLEPGRIHRSEYGVEEVGDAEVIHEGAGGGAVFVGEDGAADAAGFEGFEEFAGAGEEGDAVEHVCVPVGAVDGEGFFEEGGVFFAEEALDGDFEAAADGAVNLFHGGLGEAEGAHGVDVGFVDGGEVIEEGAIEVEEDGAEAVHGAEQWAAAGD